MNKESATSAESSSENISLEVLPPNAIEAMSRGEIDCQIATAHKFPRSLDKFNKRAEMMATMDVETAESCLYVRPVGGGKTAEGMSVRMAEIVGACYGNLRVSAMLVEQTETFVRARGMAHDLETNFASSSEVIESTLKADGKTPYDARMRVVVAKACLAKARRDATFQVVPRALARPIERAVRTLLSDQNVLTFAERRAAAVKWIESKKIDAKRVWTVLGVNGADDLNQEHLDLLTGLKTAIKDGETTIDEAFPNLGPAKPIFSKKTEKQITPNEGAGGAAKSDSPTPAESGTDKSDTAQPSSDAAFEEAIRQFEEIKGRVESLGWTEEQFIAACASLALAPKGAKTYDTLAEVRYPTILQRWPEIVTAIEKGAVK